MNSHQIVTLLLSLAAVTLALRFIRWNHLLSSNRRIQIFKALLIIGAGSQLAGMSVAAIAKEPPLVLFIFLGTAVFLTLACTFELRKLSKEFRATRS